MFKSPVTVLYLPEECFDGSRSILNEAMHYYQAITDGGRLPDNAGMMLKILHDIEIYIGEVQNGGHGQHLDNAEPSKAQIEAIRDAFLAAGAHQISSVVTRYIEQAKSRLEHGYRSGGPNYYTLLRPLDLEYYSLESQRHPDSYFAAFLEGEPWVKKMPGSRYDKALAALRKWVNTERRNMAAGNSGSDTLRDLAAMVSWFISPDPNRPWWKA